MEGDGPYLLGVRRAVGVFADPPLRELGCGVGLPGPRRPGENDLPGGVELVGDLFVARWWGVGD
jgi:hypothetical protein